MRIVFLGDISVSELLHEVGQPYPGLANAELVLANLEGPILVDREPQTLPRRKTLALYSTPDIFPVLQAFHINTLILANNHIDNYQLPLAETKNRLQAQGFESFGAGADLAAAAAPYVVSTPTTTVKIFAFGWHIIGCRAATATSEGVNPLTPQHAFATIQNLRATDPHSCVIFVMHWNFNIERFPQPAFRLLAHDLLAAGVDAIVGLHSHVAEGAELVQGKPAIYGLGNWFFPPRQLEHVRLDPIPIAARELALELEIEGRQVKNVLFHWHQCDAPRKRLSFEKTESWGGTILTELTPFQNMSHAEYIDFFRAHRRKSRLLPCYTDYRHYWFNQAKDLFITSREKLLDILVRYKIKGGPK